MTWEAAAGDFVVIEGPSQSGKSTLLAVAGGLLPPDRGEVWLSDKKLPRRNIKPSVRAAIGYFALQAPLIEAASARENLLLALGAKGFAMAQASDLAEAMLEDINLGDARRTPARALSRSNRHLLRLARALVGTPELVLLDDVLSGLSPNDKKTAVAVLCKYRRADNTVLVTSNDPDLSRRLETAGAEKWFLEPSGLRAANPKTAQHVAKSRQAEGNRAVEKRNDVSVSDKSPRRRPPQTPTLGTDLPGPSFAAMNPDNDNGLDDSRNRHAVRGAGQDGAQARKRTPTLELDFRKLGFPFPANAPAKPVQKADATQSAQATPEAETMPATKEGTRAVSRKVGDPGPAQTQAKTEPTPASTSAATTASTTASVTANDAGVDVDRGEAATETADVQAKPEAGSQKAPTRPSTRTSTKTSTKAQAASGTSGPKRAPKRRNSKARKKPKPAQAARADNDIPAVPPSQLSTPPRVAHNAD